MKKIIGYADKLSVAPGDKLNFMVSCEVAGDYDAQIVRLICGDSNPEGPGIKEEVIGSPANGTYRGRKQHIYSGSHVVVPASAQFDGMTSFTLQAFIWPTLPLAPNPRTRPGLGPCQAILGQWSEVSKSGYVLMLDQSGAVALRIGDGTGTEEIISTHTPVIPRHWYFVAATYDAKSKRACVIQEPLAEIPHADTAAMVESDTSSSVVPQPRTPFMIAAYCQDWHNDQPVAGGCYNGKIDRPRLAGKVLTRSEMTRLVDVSIDSRLRRSVIGSWDFSNSVSSRTALDTSPNNHHGHVVNLPSRGMTGFNWSGTECSWRRCPAEYGAIHFHEDDLHDAGWEPDFSLVVPKSMRSGIYAAKVRIGEAEDYIPFFVRPERGTATAKIAFLASTATYLAYANDHMNTDVWPAELLCDRLTILSPEDVFLHEHREYGLSSYDTHVDGSGVAYSSSLRPILNMRPNYQHYLGGHGSTIWTLNADLHLVDWLEAKGYDFDVITDEDIHFEGLELLSSYNVVLTGAHPEYCSMEMWKAIEAYTGSGGRFMYLGGNGFYWHMVYDPEDASAIEVRRAEGGTRSWSTQPGENYHSFNGAEGGTWRRRGRPPQQLVGVGFTAQAFDVSSYYRRQPGSFDPRAGFVFEGIEDDELIGDFGLIGGGAAGIELDRADAELGTPPNTLVLASSEGHTDLYLLVVEEVGVNRPGLTGSEEEMVRADLVFFETTNGGAVFSTGSIAWCGSLSHDDYDNNVSRISDNVLRKFAQDGPLHDG